DYARGRLIIVLSLDTNTLEWSSVRDTTDFKDDVPFNPFGHTVVADGHMIYLWGGKNYTGYNGSGCDELFAFNSLTLKWSRPEVSGDTPDARIGHSATVCGRKMYIFGGFDLISRRYFQDVHSLDLDTFTWNEIVTE